MNVRPMHREDRCGFLAKDGEWWDITPYEECDGYLCEEEGCDLPAQYEAQSESGGEGSGYVILCVAHMCGWSGLNLVDEWP